MDAGAASLGITSFNAVGLLSERTDPSTPLSGRYHSGEFNPFGSTSSDFVPDFARSAPDREMMTAAACDAGVMDELLGAVNIVVARQNQWCPASERSTLQVTRAAQSSTHLFICKSVDEKSCDLEDVYTPRSLCSFDEESAFPVFFKHSTCYDVMPKSAKLLILDSTLPIRKAIQSLTDHALDAAPVWSSRLQTYTHVLTQDICLRLLAQVFPNDKPDGQEPPPERNPAADLSYWEGKTLGSVLKTYNAWARTEDSNLQLETPCVVTPQQHLHRVVQLLTVGVPVKKRAHSTVSKETMAMPTAQNSASDCSSTYHQQPSAESEDAPMQQSIPPPRHVVIADLAGSGNLLGILTSDRLLAYLRVRMRNLPNPSLLKVQVGDLIGVRWEERSWPVGDPFTISGSRLPCATTVQQSPSSAATSVPATSTGSPFYLHPSTTCLQALHIMNSAWATMGLVCLPVATETGRGFQGMLSKMDILSCVFSDTVAVSLSTPISLLLAARPRPPGCTSQAMCFITDSLLTVIDSIFRQKASCLAVFEKPGTGASWNGQAALGPAIGVVTTSDLLYATILDSSYTKDSPQQHLVDGQVASALSRSSSDSRESPAVTTAFYRSQNSVPSSSVSSYSLSSKRNSLPVTVNRTPQRPGENTLDASFGKSPRPLTQLPSPLGPNSITRFFHRQKRNSESETHSMQLEGPFQAHSYRRPTIPTTYHSGVVGDPESAGITASGAGIPHSRLNSRSTAQGQQQQPWRPGQAQKVTKGKPGRQQPQQVCGKQTNVDEENIMFPMDFS
ncbi:hypothetical protein SprV_0501826700 [Sparganum proliferum]